MIQLLLRDMLALHSALADRIQTYGMGAQYSGHGVARCVFSVFQDEAATILP